MGRVSTVNGVRSLSRGRVSRRVEFDHHRPLTGESPAGTYGSRTCIAAKICPFDLSPTLRSTKSLASLTLSTSAPSTCIPSGGMSRTVAWSLIMRSASSSAHNPEPGLTPPPGSHSPSQQHGTRSSSGSGSGETRFTVFSVEVRLEPPLEVPLFVWRPMSAGMTSLRCRAAKK